MATRTTAARAQASSRIMTSQSSSRLTLSSTAKENFKQWISKVGSTGVNLGSPGYSGAEFKSGEIMANVAKKPLAELTAKELGAFAKAITVNKADPRICPGQQLRCERSVQGRQVRQGSPADTLHGGFSMVSVGARDPSTNTARQA